MAEGLAFRLEEDDEQLSEEDVLTLLKDTFDATEVEGR